MIYSKNQVLWEDNIYDDEDIWDQDDTVDYADFNKINQLDEKQSNKKEEQKTNQNDISTERNNDILDNFGKYEDDYKVEENSKNNDKNILKTPQSSERLSKISKNDLDSFRIHEKAKDILLQSDSESTNKFKSTKQKLDKLMVLNDNLYQSEKDLNDSNNDNEAEESEEDDDTPHGVYVHPNAVKK